MNAKIIIIAIAITGLIAFLTIGQQTENPTDAFKYPRIYYKGWYTIECSGVVGIYHTCWLGAQIRTIELKVIEPTLILPKLTMIQPAKVRVTVYFISSSGKEYSVIAQEIQETTVPGFYEFEATSPPIKEAGKWIVRVVAQDIEKNITVEKIESINVSI